MQTPDVRQHTYQQQAVSEKGNRHKQALHITSFLCFWMMRLNVLVERCFLGSLTFFSNLGRTNIALVPILTRIRVFSLYCSVNKTNQQFVRFRDLTQCIPAQYMVLSLVTTFS